MLFLKLLLILVKFSRCTVASDVADTPLSGGVVLNTSVTDSSLQALPADEYSQYPSDNNDLPLPGLEKRRPVKSAVACK